VAELLKRLSDAQVGEEDELTKTLERTKVKAAFYRKLGKGF